MRNKKLLQLQDAAEISFKRLTDYLWHLDARETNPDYVHARMLFEEGWRYAINFDPSPGLVVQPLNVLWYDTDEDSEPEYIAAKEILDDGILKTLGLVELVGSVAQQIEALSIKKDEAVKNADYSEAASCRDQIWTLKNGAINHAQFVDEYASLVNFLIELTEEVGEAVPQPIQDLIYKGQLTGTE